MQLPQGLTEHDVIVALDKVAHLVVQRFAKRLVGVLDREDLAQQTRLWALEAIATGKFDPTRGKLDAFCWVHCRNRASNLHRDRVHRHDPPCERCASDDPCSDGQHCTLYAQWKARNDAKWMINRGIPLDTADPDSEPRMSTTDHVESGLSADELSRLIDEELQVDLRHDYLRMLAGDKVEKRKRIVVQRAVTEILERHGVDVPAYGEDQGLAEETERQRLVADGQGNFQRSSVKSSEQSEAEEAADPPRSCPEPPNTKPDVGVLPAWCPRSADQSSCVPRRRSPGLVGLGIFRSGFVTDRLNSPFAAHTHAPAF
jgi:DNA-directed RNA polymerase specialized sigma24 family protein